MSRLQVGVAELMGNRPAPGLWNRVMKPNFASIMPQVIAVWCEQLGHDVAFVCDMGDDELTRELPSDLDVLFISSFTNAAQRAAAISSQYRARGIVTVVGGPHARCYPEDAARYFDYVLGFTDKGLVSDVLRDCAPHRPTGLMLSARKQPAHLPGVRERWKFIEPTIARAPAVRIVPMISSLGCPYSCSFCVDSEVPYEPLASDQIQEDLRFLLRTLKRPIVGWHDPNFGIRFEETMAAIEEVVPPGAIDFAAESSLSILSEPHLRRLRKNGFVAILPGIESWYDMAGKSKTGGTKGRAKVDQVSDHVNQVLRHIPYVQANFVLGLDSDEGEEPFELTRLFVEKTPGVFPAYSLFSAFGRAAPLNLELQRDGRVLPIPFHFLDNNQAMNVRPRNYSWTSLYDHIIELRRYSFSPRAVARRFAANEGLLTRSLNLVRALSTEGRGRVRHDTVIRGLLDTDRSMRRFLEGDTVAVPRFYTDRLRRDLGPLWSWLPPGGLHHDPNAYLKSVDLTPKHTSGLAHPIRREKTPYAPPGGSVDSTRVSE
jgi:hypothetical protein